MSIRWERKKPGHYQLIHRKRVAWPHDFDEGIVAEVVKGADGQWWMEYLDEKDGWICKRCSKKLANAKAVAEECCKLR